MKLSLTLIAILWAGSAFAGTRTDKLSCDQAASLVQSKGAVILHTGDGLFDRYVASGAYCDRSETTAPAWVPTRDSDACFVGYTCVQSYGDNGSSVGNGVASRSVRTCREGAREVFFEGKGEQSQPVQYVCQGGKWVNPYAAPQAPEKAQTCREGAEDMVIEPSNNGEGSEHVWYVCRSGRWLRKY